MLPSMRHGQNSSLSHTPSAPPTHNSTAKIPTRSSNFTTVRVGSAPTPSQYRIRLTFHSTFFSNFTVPCSFPNTFASGGRYDVEGTRGMGSYSPSFSRGRASRALEASMATM